MNKQSFAKMLKNASAALKKNSPAILTGIGIAGMIVTTVTAVKATPKALQIVDEKEIKDGKRMTNTEIIKATWKCYIPSAVTGVCSVACIVGASSINARRNAALATAYAISMADLSDYKKKALEIVGEKKEQAIRDAVAKEKLEKAHIEDREPIITGRGEVPCFDPLSGRYFKSDIEAIRKAENILNKRMRDELNIMLNEFYAEIGLDDCEVGEQLGWDIDKGYIDIDFSSQLDQHGTPCLVLGHHNPPRYIRWP